MPEPLSADEKDRAVLDAVVEPPELADLPVEVIQLVHAVDSMRDHWGEADEARRAELWTQVHQASDAVWGRLDAARRGDPL